MADQLPSFEDLVSRSTQLGLEQQRLAQEQKQALAQLKTHLTRVNELHNVLFKGLPDSDGHDREFPAISGPDVLTHWWVEDRAFTAVFEYSFRGQVNSFDVSLPLAYLQSDGEQRMRQDAQLLQEAQATAGRQKEQARVAQDRARYEELKARFEPTGKPEG